MLAGKGVIPAGEGVIAIGARQELGRIFNSASSLTNFEIRKYYPNKPKYKKYNGVYSRNNST